MISLVIPPWLVITLVWLSSSILLWFYPKLLHRKKQFKFSARHISHRGGSAEGYESTLRAFEHALSCGTEMLELDVRLTKDGKVVVAHDESLYRLTGQLKNVSETNYEDFPPMLHSIPVEHLPGTMYHDGTWGEEERQIPLLIQVFSRFPGVPINIDIKEHNHELIHKVADLIHAFNRVDITVWGSAEKATTDLCYQIAPNINQFFCTFKVIFTLLLALSGLLPFMRIREGYLEIFLPTVMKRIRQSNHPLGAFQRFLFTLPTLFLQFRPFNYIAHLKSRGIEVYLWVCNQEEEFDECFEIGAAAIMTDYPTKLRAYLDVKQAKVA